jgi:hypothetical protein
MLYAPTYKYILCEDTRTSIIRQDHAARTQASWCKSHGATAVERIQKAKGRCATIAGERRGFGSLETLIAYLALLTQQDEPPAASKQRTI